MSINSNLSPFIHSDSERSCHNTVKVLIICYRQDFQYNKCTWNNSQNPYIRWIIVRQVWNGPGNWQVPQIFHRDSIKYLLQCKITMCGLSQALENELSNEYKNLLTTSSEDLLWHVLGRRDLRTKKECPPTYSPPD